MPINADCKKESTDKWEAEVEPHIKIVQATDGVENPEEWDVVKILDTAHKIPEEIKKDLSEYGIKIPPHGKHSEL